MKNIFFKFPYSKWGEQKHFTVGKDGFISIGETNIISELLEGYKNENKLSIQNISFTY